MQTVILRKAAAATRCGLSVRHLDRLAAAGEFPRPIKLGLRAVGWIEHEVQAWLDQRTIDGRAKFSGDTRQ